MVAGAKTEIMAVAGDSWWRLVALLSLVACCSCWRREKERRWSYDME
jgi:hypothetical protein